MSEETGASQSASDEQIKQWAEEYKRLFEPKTSLDEQKKKLERLKEIKQKCDLESELLGKIIPHMEKQLLS